MYQNQNNQPNQQNAQQASANSSRSGRTVVPEAKGADGEVFAFIDSDAVSVNW